MRRPGEVICQSRTDGVMGRSEPLPQLLALQRRSQSGGDQLLGCLSLRMICSTVCLVGFQGAT